MKATGAEIKKFWATSGDAWPEGWTYEGPDYAFEEGDSGDQIDDSEKYDLAIFGYVVSVDGERDVSFEVLFKRWKKLQTHVDLVVTVPKDQAKAAIEYIKAHGWKVTP